MTRSSLVRVLRRSANGTCLIVMILLGAHIFGYFFTLTQVTQSLVIWVGAQEVSSWVIMTLILCGYIALGMFMDQIAILMLTVRIVLPLIKVLGFDPLWFGIIKLVTAEVGITPPVGLNCFVVARYSCRPVQGLSRLAAAFHRTYPDHRGDAGLPGDHPLAAKKDDGRMTVSRNDVP